jgi:hypothetical protein
VRDKAMTISKEKTSKAVRIASAKALQLEHATF